VTVAEWTALRDAVTQHLTPGDWLTLSGSVPAGAPDDAIESLVAAARACDASVAIDLHGPGLAAALHAGVHVVKVNHHEAADHVGRSNPGRGDHSHDDEVVHDAFIAAKGLHESCAVAVVTCGRRGAVVVADGVALRASVPRAGRFPVGSGDAFLAGLVTGLRRGDGVGSALRLASAAGTANALRPGAGRLSAADVTALLDAVELTELV
jgi:tagatose 6-phosphate kinase